MTVDRNDQLDLGGYQCFHSTRVDLLRRLGRTDEVRVEYEHALTLEAYRARAPARDRRRAE